MAAKDAPSFLSALDQIRAVALEGLRYAQNPYDIDRYTKLLETTSKHYSEILRVEQPYVLDMLRSQIGITTARLGADAAVLNNLGQLLILRRSDDRKWCLPGGGVDVHKTPAEAAVREAREEAGLVVSPKSYLAIELNGPELEERIFHHVDILTLMSIVPASTSVTLSHEHVDYTWIDKPDAPFEWHPGHQTMVRRVFDHLASGGRNAIAIGG